MIKRINIAVFQPSKIAFFLKDKMGYVFGYMALLAFLASLPVMIQLFLVSPLTAEVKQDITGVFIQKAVGCEIVSGTLACESPTNFTYGGIQLRFLKNPSGMGVQLIFEQDRIKLYSTTFQILDITYESMGVTNLDLSLKTQEDVQAFKAALVPFMTVIQPIYATTVSLLVFISNFLLYIAIAGIMAYSFGFRVEKIAYQFRFKLAAYATTSYFILALVVELYGLGYILAFGMILPFITMTIAFNGLLKMSVVIRKKDDET